MRSARAQVRVEQHAVDDEPHEQRLDHLQAGADEREPEDDADAVAMRPQPAQIFAKVLASLAAEPCGRLRRPSRPRRAGTHRPASVLSRRRPERRDAPVCSPGRSAGIAARGRGYAGIVHPLERSWRRCDGFSILSRPDGVTNEIGNDTRRLESCIASCACSCARPEWCGWRGEPAAAQTPIDVYDLADYRLTRDIRTVRAGQPSHREITRHDPAFTYAPLFTKDVAVDGDAPTMASGLAARLENHAGLARPCRRRS